MPAKRKVATKKSTKSASIYDVARESRVSVFTVSAVINHKAHVGKKLRTRVEAAIRKLNYRPNLIARSLAKQRTHTIGMIVTDIANPFFPMVVRGAEDAAQKRGYNLLLCNSDDTLDKEESSVELQIHPESHAGYSTAGRLGRHHTSASRLVGAESSRPKVMMISRPLA